MSAEAKDNKRASVQQCANEKMAKDVNLAVKAFNEGNVEELKKCFDRAVSELSVMAGAFDAMVRLYTMPGEHPRLLGKESDSAIGAMQAISLAAIDLAKTAITHRKEK